MDTLRNALSGLCLNEPPFPYLGNSHWVIYQQVLAGKVSDFSHVMILVIKRVNSRWEKALRYHLSKVVLDELDVAHRESSSKAHVGWLSGGKVLQPFVDAAPEMKTRDEEHGEPQDWRVANGPAGSDQPNGRTERSVPHAPG